MCVYVCGTDLEQVHSLVPITNRTVEEKDGEEEEEDEEEEYGV